LCALPSNTVNLKRYCSLGSYILHEELTLNPAFCFFFPFCGRKQLETPVHEMGIGMKGEGAWSQEGDEGEEGESLLDQRSSVFDRDEFDVFRRKADVDLSRVHIGKR